ncbi:MAG: hypothetical protein JWN43_903 [Gammaproteobacteria bacterium]|nr:hypothetical protein [Gammaproteobacteria bacterium]
MNASVRFLEAYAAMAVLVALTVAPPAFAQHEHDFHDTRYHLDHYYPARGATTRVLPNDRVVIGHGPDRLFYSGGVWYRRDAGGYVVVSSPYHVFVPVLPPVYTTVWIGGSSYYYANDTYYVWRPDLGQYEVVPPPDDSAATTQPQPSTPDIIAYPKNGQSEAQQSQDKYECHKWAVAQSGSDPTEIGGTPVDQGAEKRRDYQRAMAACLGARGYTVK